MRNPFRFKKKSAAVTSDAMRNFLDKTIAHIGMGTAFFNESNNNNYIKEGYKKNATVYSIINMIIRNANMIPFKVYDIKDVSKAKDYTALTSGMQTKGSLFAAKMLKAQSFTEVPRDSEIMKLLARPNPMETWGSFLSNYIGFGKLTGNRYVYGASDSKGKIKEMYVLPSQHMEIISGGILEPIDGYNLTYAKDAKVDFERDEVLHVKDFNPNFDFSGSHLYGQSPLEAAFRILETNNEAVTTNKKQLQSQVSRGLLVAKEMDGISKGQAKALDGALKRKMKEANGSIAITNQPMEWINFGLSPSDLELIKQNDATTKDLCSIYGVPVVLLNNTESSSYNNIKEAKSFFFQNAVNPEMVRLRDELNKWLVPAYGENLYIDFDFTVIPELQEDVSEMVNQLDKAWYLKPNEKRKVLYYPEDVEEELMNQYFVPVNLMPMKNMDFQSLRALEDAKRNNPLPNKD